MVKSRDPDPICDREELIYRVSNVRDGEPWQGKHLRSTWVCGDRACVLDAMAWAERAGGDRAVVYNTDMKEEVVFQ